jgi:hypothetical protein
MNTLKPMRAGRRKFWIIHNPKYVVTKVCMAGFET